MKHRHHDLICLWAANPGIRFQCRENSTQEWEDVDNPSPWHPYLFYRIKPEKKDDLVTEAKILGPYKSVMWNSVTDQVSHANIRLTFDGETGKLKHAEVLT